MERKSLRKPVPLLENFISKGVPHNISNGAPGKGEVRHEWESKLLYSVIDKLEDRCSLLDYGCWRGTLRYTLLQHYPNAIYYGLDTKLVIDQNYDPKMITDQLNESDVDYENTIVDYGSDVHFRYLDKLEDTLSEVDCMIAGSVFTHLDWESIIDVLDKTLPHYERGFEIGFTVFLGDSYELYGKNHYGYSNTYHVVILEIKMFEDYCRKNNLELSVLPYVQKLDHIVPGDKTYQSFLTIKRINL